MSTAGEPIHAHLPGQAAVDERDHRIQLDLLNAGDGQAVDDAIAAWPCRTRPASQYRAGGGQNGRDVLGVIHRATNNHRAGMNGDQRDVGGGHRTLQNALEIFHIQLDDHLKSLRAPVLGSER